MHFGSGAIARGCPSVNTIESLSFCGQETPGFALNINERLLPLTSHPSSK
jgi:hypothetical protein